MKNKMDKTEEYENCPEWEQDTYQTGFTRPPKSYGGVIAFLLVLVIFLCGISTALGLMNIRLFHQLTAAQKDSAVVFSQSAEDDHASNAPLGFTGQDIPEIWCLYQDIPRGVYITEVDDRSDAAARGIVPGDILVSLDGEPTGDNAALQTLLNSKLAQAAVRLGIYRAGEHLHVTVELVKKTG